MSWDIVFCASKILPPRMEDMTQDWKFVSMGSLSDVRTKLSAIAADIDWSDETWGVLDREEFSIELNVGSESPCMDFALYINGGVEAVIFIESILERYDWYAVDTTQGEWLHHCDDMKAGLNRFNHYKSKVIK